MTPHNKQETIKNSESRTTTNQIPGPWVTPMPPKETPPIPQGDDADASQSQESFTDTTGAVWFKPPKGKGDVAYSVPFKSLWKFWLDSSGKSPLTIKAADKRKTYSLCYEHVSKGGLTTEELMTSARNYLRPYLTGKETTRAKNPATFYGKQHWTFLEHLGTAEDGGRATTLRDRWHNPRDAWRECASLSTHLGLELPDVPKRTYGAEWEDVEKFHPLIVEFATDRSGFKQVPDDLSSRIQGVG
jgi:hypothetical protein